MVLFVILLFLTTVQLLPITRQFVDEINSREGQKWISSENTLFSTLSEDAARKMSNGVKLRPETLELYITNTFDENQVVIERRALPTDFIFWESYTECDNKPPMQQGECGDCWLTSHVQAVNDRFCYQHAKANHYEPWYTTIKTSAQHAASCWNDQMPDSGRDVCDGGFLEEGSEFMSSAYGGIVDDVCFGPYGPFEKLGAPYAWDDCPGCPFISCPGTCPASPFGDDTKLWSDRWFTNGVGYTEITGSPGPAKILAVKQEIFDNGPVLASMEVFTDFQTYTGGIYEYTSGSTEGYHAVEIIGWGSAGDDYWVVKNSWGSSSWGEVQGNYDGYFRIIQGQNEVGILSQIIAPDVDISIPCSTPCENGGVCSAPDHCTCPEGYDGEFCEDTHCYGLLSNDTLNVCSGNGDCEEEDLCVCHTGYFGRYCNITECAGEFSNVTETCNGHGDCYDYNKCTCSSNYYGTVCDITTCSGVFSNMTNACGDFTWGCWPHENCSCSNNYYGDYCNITTCGNYFSNETDDVCRGHGNCWPYEECNCTDTSDYFGTNCQYTWCNGYRSDITQCSNHGTCWPINECTCDPLYHGLDCNITWCDSVLSNDSNVCLGRGVCWPYGVCDCVYNRNYTGSNCEEPLCYGSSGSDACGGTEHGVCVGVNNCSCIGYFSGNQCETDNTPDDDDPTWYQDLWNGIQKYWVFITIGTAVVFIILCTLCILAVGTCFAIVCMGQVKKKTKPSCSCLASWTKLFCGCGFCPC